MKKILLLCLFTLFIFVSCKQEEVVAPNPYRDVHYRVTGNATTVSVAYGRADYSSFFIGNCPLPFDIAVENMVQGKIASLVAQNDGSVGTLTAFIISNGDTLKKASTSIAFGVVSISCEIP